MEEQTCWASHKPTTYCRWLQMKGGGKSATVTCMECFMASPKFFLPGLNQ